MASARHTIGAVLTLRDNMSATLRGVRREQQAFKREVKSVKSELDSTFKKNRKVKLDSTVAHKKIQQLRKEIKPLRQKIATAVAIKDMASQKIQRVSNRLKVLKSKAFRPVVAIQDKTASFFSSFKKNIMNLKTFAMGALAGIGVGKMFQSGGMLEQQQIAMQHFIRVNNQGRSEADITKMRDEYITGLRNNANLTPFETTEVISAGSRALNVVGGNTKDAMSLVKLAEDMAALNPEKSLKDAMEALADARLGEFERMKEFGFKISADEFKGLVGKGKNDDLTEKETTEAYKKLVENKLNPYFEGGAQELSKSGLGLISTIKGKISSKIQDTGLKIVERAKPQLESFISWMDENSATMDIFANAVSSGIGFVLDGFTTFSNFISNNMPLVNDTIGNVSSWISNRFGWVRNETGFLKDTFASAIPAISNVLQVGWKVMKPVFDLIASAVESIYYIFKWAFPGVKNIVTSVWDIVSPILNKLGDALGWVADKAGKIANWLGKKLENKTETTTIVNGSHANGLASVPFNGYIAKLHKGERVLTKEENKNYSNNSKSVIIQKVIDKIADTIVIREEADIEKIGNDVATKVELALANM